MWAIYSIITDLINLNSNISTDKIPEFKKNSQSSSSLNPYSNSNGMQEDSEFNSGQGGLRWEDIKGASPSKFKRGRKLFVDRNEVKSVLGQSPGKYHGFANDYSKGGTYKHEDESNIIISDYRRMTKSKIENKFIATNDENKDTSLNQSDNKPIRQSPSVRNFMMNGKLQLLIFKVNNDFLGKSTEELIKNNSIERTQISSKANLNRTYEDASQNRLLGADKEAPIFREKKKSVGQKLEYFNYSSYNNNGTNFDTKLKSNDMLKFPQMTTSNNRNSTSASRNKSFYSNGKTDIQFTAEQFLRMRNSGYFAGDTIGSAPQLHSIKASNFRGAQPQNFVAK